VKDREERIQFEMGYCQHYHPQGAKIICTAGVDLDKLQRVPAPLPSGGTLKCGPCIGGHVLENPHAICPHWIRRTREMGEKRADGIERSLSKMALAGPVISAWRKKEPRGKAEVIECPVCKGRLSLSQSAYNGHVHGRCSTPDCLNWME
jgi:hypothetical protein